MPVRCCSLRVIVSAPDLKFVLVVILMLYEVLTRGIWISNLCCTDGHWQSPRLEIYASTCCNFNFGRGSDLLCMDIFAALMVIGNLPDRKFMILLVIIFTWDEVLTRRCMDSLY
jgi:hypothetical protein